MAFLMIKLLYLSLVVAVLSPSFFTAMASIHAAHMEKQIQADQQSRAGDSVYVIHKEMTIGWGRFRVLIYPHAWAAILVFAGLMLSIIGLVFLFFVRL